MTTALKESKGKGIRKYKDYVLVIDRYLIPLLGKYRCHNITRDVLREFSENRIQMMGRVPSRSTVSTHNVALNHVLRKAYELKYIDTMPTLIADGEIKKRCPSFSEDEYRVLHTFMRSDLAKSKNISRLIVSTEDQKISEYCSSLRVEVHARPEILSKDDTPIDDVLQDLLDNYYEKENVNPMAIALLQPTSPFLQAGT